MSKFSPPLNKRRPADEENRLIEDLKRLKELREHYGLEEVKGLETWVNLSLFLARNFVPGFQHQGQKGRKVDDGIEAGFLTAVSAAMKKNGCDHAKAIKIMDQDLGGRHYYEQCRHLKKTRPDFTGKLEALNEKTAD